MIEEEDEEDGYQGLDEEATGAKSDLWLGRKGWGKEELSPLE